MNSHSNQQINNALTRPVHTPHPSLFSTASLAPQLSAYMCMYFCVCVCVCLFVYVCVSVFVLRVCVYVYVCNGVDTVLCCAAGREPDGHGDCAVLHARLQPGPGDLSAGHQGCRRPGGPHQPAGHRGDQMQSENGRRRGGGKGGVRGTAGEMEKQQQTN